MFAQIRSAAVKRLGRRSGAPVRRNSRPLGKCEGDIWHRTDRRDVRQIVLAAKRYELENKAPGKRNGPLGSIALEILDLLANLVDFKTGRLDPSINTMMQRLRRSRDAIVRGLNALRQHGFVDWLRRFVPVEENEGQKGPQVKQASNAYRLVMPERAKAALGRYSRKAAPPPDDAVQAKEQRSADLIDFLQFVTLDEEEIQALFRSPNPADHARARLAILMKERESAKRSEPHSSFIYNGKE